MNPVLKNVMEQRDIFKQELIENYNAALKAFAIWQHEHGYINSEFTTDEIVQHYLNSKEFY